MSTTAKAKDSNIFCGGIIIDRAHEYDTYGQIYDRTLFVGGHGEYLRKYKVLDIFDGVCDGWNVDCNKLIAVP